MPEPITRGGVAGTGRPQDSAGRAASAMYRSGVMMTRREAAAVAATALPLYRGGRCTWQALTAACRVLYAGYDGYRPETKAHLLSEARRVLRAAEPRPAAGVLPGPAVDAVEAVRAWPADAHADQIWQALGELRAAHERAADLAVDRFRGHLAAGRDDQAAAAATRADVAAAWPAPAGSAVPGPDAAGVDGRRIDAATVLATPPGPERLRLTDNAAAERAVDVLRGQGPAEVAEAAIGLYREYRDIHGHDGASADAHARQEIREGVEAAYDNAWNDLAYRAELHDQAGHRPAGEPAAPGPHHTARPAPADAQADRRAAEERERIRDAVLAGSLTPEQAAEVWPADDPYAPMARTAAQIFADPGHPPTGAARVAGTEPAPDVTGQVGACDAAVEAAQAAVDRLDHTRQNPAGQDRRGQDRAEQLARWHAEDRAHDAETVWHADLADGLDLSGDGLQ